MDDPNVREAVALANSGQRAVVFRFVTDRLRRDPQDAAAWLILAQIVEEHNEAIYCMRQVVRLRPDDAQARQVLIRMQWGQSFEEAVRESAAGSVAPSVYPRPSESLSIQPSTRKRGRSIAPRRSQSAHLAISHRLNFPLVVGLMLVTALILIAAIGEYVAPFDPLEVHYIVQDTSGEFHTPPFKPGELEEFPLGSDIEGRDILSRLLVGVRPTLVLVILIAGTRLVVGTIMGLLDGWYGGLVGDVIGSATKIALGIPVLVIAIMVIYLFGPQFQAGVFIVALSVVGWGQTARVVANRVKQVRGETYIEAARALGASDARILWTHIVPQVRSLLLITLSFEMSTVLLQMAELGFLGFFMGGGAIMLIPDGKTPAFIPERIAGAPELGQMLAGGWQNFIYTPTLPVIVGTTFFLAVFSFMMLGEGLKSYYAEPTSPGLVSALRSSNLTHPLLERLGLWRIRDIAPSSLRTAS